MGPSFPFGFVLVTTCGDTLGTVESRECHYQAGDAVHLDGIGYRVTAVIPLERMAEFVDEPMNGVLEVVPL